MKRRHRYRWRTRLRRWLPFSPPVYLLVPKGKGSCGEHELYRQDLSTVACYHCRTVQVITPALLAELEEQARQARSHLTEMSGSQLDATFTATMRRSA